MRVRHILLAIKLAAQESAKCYANQRQGLDLRSAGDNGRLDAGDEARLASIHRNEATVPCEVESHNIEQRVACVEARAKSSAVSIDGVDGLLSRQMVA
jgi:hypothetical protein